MKIRFLKYLTSIIPSKHIVWHGDRKNNSVALTFDDGPHPEHTPKVLDCLKANGIRATFFLQGRHVETYPHIAKEILSDAHAIGNHTYSHNPLKHLPDEQLRFEIEEGEEIIKNTLQHNVSIFRPPNGSCSLSALRFLAKKGLTTVFWSVDPKDFAAENVHDILDKIDIVRGGDIILLHDKTKPLVNALPILIEYLTLQGMQFVTIPEMISEEGERNESVSEPIHHQGNRYEQLPCLRTHLG